MNKDKAIQLLERLQDPEPYEPMLTKDAYDAIQMAIDALSADGDTISRKAAIDAIDEIESEIADGFGFEYEKWRKYFCDLPPAQPEQLSTNLAEVGTDCISRQAAIDTFKDCAENGVGIDGIVDALESLPSAHPERIKGRWIAKEKKNLFRCSKCDAVIYSESEYDRNEFHKFCGRCGADMREVTT